MIDRETLIARIDFFTAECERDSYTDTGEAHELLAEIREALAAPEGVADFRNMPADAKPRALGAGASSTACDDQHTTARRL